MSKKLRWNSKELLSRDYDASSVRSSNSESFSKYGSSSRVNLHGDPLNTTTLKKSGILSGLDRSQSHTSIMCDIKKIKPKMNMNNHMST